MSCLAAAATTAFALAAACGSEVLDDVAAGAAEHAEEALLDCSAYTDSGYRVSDAYTTLRDGVGTTPWRLKLVGREWMRALAAPTPSNNVTLVITSLHPSCATSEADALQARGYVTVDGSTNGVTFWRGGGGTSSKFYATLTLTRSPTSSTVHTIAIVIPPARPGGATITRPLDVQAEMTNPFTFLNRSFDDVRCNRCHDAGDVAATNALHFGMYAVGGPGTTTTCTDCHDMVSGYYGVGTPNDDLNDPDNNFEDSWRTPPFAMGIQWSTLTPVQRCQAAVNRLVNVKGFPDAYTGIFTHFFDDPRLRWAVEDGYPHDHGGGCVGTGNGPAPCNRAWPYNYSHFRDLAADWAFYTLMAPDPCSNILTSQYPMTSLAN